MIKRFPFYRQLDQMDCGPTCLQMIAKYHGRTYALGYLRDHSYIDREGVSVRGISEAAEHIGMRTLAVKIPYQTDNDEEADLLSVPLPCIVHWQQKHFVVVYRVNKKNVWIADPGKSKLRLTRKEFERSWISDQNMGVALLLEPSPDFYALEGEPIKKTGLGFLFRYLKPYRRLIGQLGLGLLLGSIFQLIFPFLTQAIVDVGIENQNNRFHLPHPDGAADAVPEPNGGQHHSKLDIAAHRYPGQRQFAVRFFDQTDEVAHRLFRFQNDRRPAPAHQ